jgi:hypothetical protein
MFDFGFRMFNFGFEYFNSVNRLSENNYLLFSKLDFKILKQTYSN